MFYSLKNLQKIAFLTHQIIQIISYCITMAIFELRTIPDGGQKVISNRMAQWSQPWLEPTAYYMKYSEFHKLYNVCFIQSARASGFWIGEQGGSRIRDCVVQRLEVTGYHPKVAMPHVHLSGFHQRRKWDAVRVLGSVDAYSRTKLPPINWRVSSYA